MVFWAFLWSGVFETSEVLNVQREIVCAPRDEVGLVFIHLNDWNKATMIKDFGAIKGQFLLLMAPLANYPGLQERFLS